jgi:hypothetical protein
MISPGTGWANSSGVRLPHLIVNRHRAALEAGDDHDDEAVAETDLRAPVHLHANDERPDAELVVQRHLGHAALA